MPTNEERREVARKLRGARSTRASMDEIWGVLDNILLTGEGSKDAPWDDTFDRLADLIEPEPERTCHPVLMDWTGNHPYYTGGISLDAMTMGCSECGCPWRREAGNLPSYCPNCGAKVMI